MCERQPLLVGRRAITALAASLSPLMPAAALPAEVIAPAHERALFTLPPQSVRWEQARRGVECDPGPSLSRGKAFSRTVGFTIVGAAKT